MPQELLPVVQAIDARAWYPLVAGLLTLAIHAYKKFQPLVWNKIPSRWQWAPAMLVAGATGFVDAELTGKTLTMALVMTLYSFFSIGAPAVGMAHTVKRIAASKNPRPPPSMKPTVVALILLVPGCGLFHPSPRSVSDVAHDLCESVLVGRAEVLGQAKRAGLSPAEVAQALCAVNSIVRPFLLSAGDAGDAAVGNAQQAGLLRR